MAIFLTPSRPKVDYKGVETLAEKGIGGLLSPWRIRREGRARPTAPLRP